MFQKFCKSYFGRFVSSDPKVTFIKAKMAILKIKGVHLEIIECRKEQPLLECMFIKEFLILIPYFFTTHSLLIVLVFKKYKITSPTLIPLLFFQIMTYFYFFRNFASFILFIKLF